MEGTFNKAFRSGLQPVEIGHRVTRVLDDGRALGVDGRPVAPNNIGVYLSPADFERFSSFAEALARELAEAARQHARDENYVFLGPVEIAIEVDQTASAGTFLLAGEVVAAPGGGVVGSLVLPDGRRVPVGDDPVTIGRLADCEITVTDKNVSRRHAEIRRRRDAIVLVDLDSTNGTLVNGSPVKESPLVDGDEVAVGETVLRYELA